MGVHDAVKLPTNRVDNQRVAVAERTDRRTAGCIEVTAAAVVDDRATIGGRHVTRNQARVTIENVLLPGIQLVGAPWKA